MGEVYRARDTRLERDVAIKILPEQLSSNNDLRTRFQREAKAISGLQHPHICVLHDVGSQNGLDFLVMEFIDGETLAARLERKPLTRAETLKIAVEISDALDRAHRSGIIHRDLKPGNIMLTKSGAKLMDFGLAKAADFIGTQAAAPAFSVAAVTSPASPLTMAGAVVGTVQYMSPEQIQGKEADERSDIFAFGAVLYEMLTGKKAFEGKSQLSVASAILDKDPVPISKVEPLTPPSLEHLVNRALEKDPDARWQSIADVRGELAWLLQASPDASSPPIAAKEQAWKLWAVAAVALLAVLSLALLLWQSRRPLQAPLLNVSILPPVGGNFAFYGDNGSEPVLSPDGKRLAFAAVVKGKQAIYVRDLDGDTPHLLPGSEGGRFPFWAPDSKQIGYFAGNGLMKIDLSTRVATQVTKVDNPRGGSWSSDGNILFTPNFRSPIYVVSATGGIAKPVTKIDTSQHTSHRWPTFLPDGEHFIYLAANHRVPTDSNNAIFVGSLKGDTPKRLTGSVCNAMVVGGRLFFCREDNLYTQALDLRRYELTGEAKVLTTSIMRDLSTWRAMFSVTAGGLLAFAPGAPVPGSELMLLDRSGKAVSRVGEIRDYLVLSMSRRGDKFAVEVSNPNSIWIGNVSTNTLFRLTFSGISARQPVISPDGTQVAFASDVDGKVAVLRKLTNGFGGEDTLLRSNEAYPNDWSPDGKYLMIQSGGTADYELFALELFGNRSQIPLVRIPGQQAYDGAFSPDMKWFLYTSTESGREEVFVSPLDLKADPNAAIVRPTARWQISNGGGLGQWSQDGREIYYISSDGKMMVVPVRSGATSFEVGNAKELFPIAVRNMTGMPYDLTADRKFLVTTELQAPSSPVTLISEWHQLVRQ